MKRGHNRRIGRWLAIAGIALFAPFSQAADPIEESAVILANYIAADTGRDPSEHMEYARSLAKTLALLSKPKQEEIFGPAIYALLSGVQNSGKAYDD